MQMTLLLLPAQGDLGGWRLRHGPNTDTRTHGREYPCYRLRLLSSSFLLTISISILISKSVHLYPYLYTCNPPPHTHLGTAAIDGPIMAIEGQPIPHELRVRMRASARRRYRRYGTRVAEFVAEFVAELRMGVDSWRVDDPASKAPVETQPNAYLRAHVSLTKHHVNTHVNTPESTGQSTLCCLERTLRQNARTKKKTWLMRAWGLKSRGRPRNLTKHNCISERALLTLLAPSSPPPTHASAHDTGHGRQRTWDTTSVTT